MHDLLGIAGGAIVSLFSEAFTPWTWPWCTTFVRAGDHVMLIAKRLAQVRQAAVDGELPIWGTQTRHDPVLSLIAPSYWQFSDFDETSLLADERRTFIPILALGIID